MKLCCSMFDQFHLPVIMRKYLLHTGRKIMSVANANSSLKSKLCINHIIIMIIFHVYLFLVVSSFFRTLFSLFLIFYTVQSTNYKLTRCSDFQIFVI